MSWPGRSRRRLIIALALVVLIAGVEAREFVWPASDAPQPADMVVVLGPFIGSPRLPAARELLQRYPAKLLLLSTFDAAKDCQGMSPPPGAARVMCFRPDPYTTRGEARFAARVARKYGYRSMTVVSTADQLNRARFRFSRCWDGPLYMLEAPASLSWRLRILAYENAAMIKAQVFQRGC